MRHALFVPPFDGLAEPDRLVELAVAAESSGWDGLFLWDHLLYSAPVRDVLDPYVSLGAIAAATSRLVIGPMVTPLARRRPAVLARQALSVERLSRGRLVLGLGLGDDAGPAGEFSSFGDESDPAVRAAMLDEGLGVLAGLLSGETVRHSGPHYVVRDVALRPAPERTGGIPLWLAARWPHRRPLRRAARHDGVVVIQMDDPADLVPLRDELARAGADLATFDVVVQRTPGDDASRWAAGGVTWLMTRVGPYRIDVDEAMSLARCGPRR